MKIDKEEFYKKMDDGELFREWLCLCNLYVLVSGGGGITVRGPCPRTATENPFQTSYF